ncbi:MAG: hypothetical protein C0616_14240 [Desulfuromonas sp.]|nr:MAG: hypothetical protein C0616_14240 [Desulfuromonas sp.]
MKNLPKFAIISTVKAPGNELAMFVNYHLNIGIDEIILFFDDPDDPYISQFSADPNVTGIPCTSDYWEERGFARPGRIANRQMVNVNHGATIARSKGCNWAIHIDSDELIYPNDPEYSSLKAYPDWSEADAIKFSLKEAIVERCDYEHIFLPQLFKHQCGRLKIALARLLGCSRAIIDQNYFRGHLASKMAIKLNDKTTEIGIHGPSKHCPDLKTHLSKTLLLLHYDCIGFKNWSSKWGMRTKSIGEGHVMRKHRLEQFNDFILSQKQGDEAPRALYERLHVIPQREIIILSLLGMTKQIVIHDSLFSSRNDA